MHSRMPAGTLDPGHTSVGVKQGCPLSPTLFGLYIDGLQHYVAAACPNAGPALCTAPGVQLNLLIYADDTAILADSAEHLQQLITCVDNWCCAHGMTISIVKSEGTQFSTVGHLNTLQMCQCKAIDCRSAKPSSTLGCDSVF
jgi:hypothetical protein